MDERLRQKLELLGEVALPESLTAGELFRRMDSGQLVLPEGPGTGAAPDRKVIPWAKVLRRGVPIAACLALVVLLSQGGLWRMGSSGGANLSAAATAPQGMESAADQAAVDEAQQYSLDGAAPEPDPGPRAIILDGAEEEADEDAPEAPADITARAENGEVKSAEAADAQEDPDNANPDSGSYYDSEDPDNANPDLDIGPSDYEREQNTLKAVMETASIEEMCGQLYLYDGSLAGLTPVLEIYGPVDAMSPDPSYPLHIWCRYQNHAGEVVARRVIYCSVDQKNADGSCVLSLLTFGEWDGGDTPLIKWNDLG